MFSSRKHALEVLDGPHPPWIVLENDPRRRSDLVIRVIRLRAGLDAFAESLQATKKLLCGKLAELFQTEKLNCANQHGGGLTIVTFSCETRK
jgi:hypothetical protein